MRYKYILTFIIMTMLSFICIGQNGMEENRRVKKLKESTKFKNDEISIIAKIIDSTKNINIYLINRTTDTLNIFGGYNAEILFNKEIKNIDGIWKPFDQLSERTYICGTGLRTINLFKDSYTYEIYHKRKYTGKLNTEIRFSFRIKDSLTIYSKPLEVNVNSDLLLKHSDRIKKILYNKLKHNDTLSTIVKEKIISKILSINSRDGDYKESIITCKEYLGSNPNSLRVRYELGRVIFKYTAKHRNQLTKVQVNTLLSWAINELKSIPNSDNPISEKSIESIDYYSKLLLSKSEWQELIQEECITENEYCLGYFKELSDQKISVLYKD